MTFTDEQIFEILNEYIKDSRYKQAILIDGPWGAGKTFFIKEKLIDQLKSNFPNRLVFYISLYGLNDFNQIMNELYTNAIEYFFDNKFGEGKGEKVGKGLNFASKIFSVGLKYFNIDPDKLPSLSDIKEIKDAVIIFDDLERCNIDINQVLGFINNLAEHNNIKVILVANQAEIGKIKISGDLPQKYLLAIDSRIILDELKYDKPNTQDKKTFNKEELISRTDKLFSDDILYNKIKEKLIGLTIYYQTDFDSIYESIVEKYIKSVAAKKYLKENKQFILDIFKNKQHYNIRTLLFGIIAYEKFFEIINNIHFNPTPYLQEQKDKILKYTMELSIQIKSGNPTYSWNNNSAETGIVYFGKSILNGSIFGYKFVDMYLLYHYLNPDEIKNIVLSIMNEKKTIDNDKKAKSELILNELHAWWELEDEEIADFLNKMKIELTEEKYHPDYFKDIIIILIQMKSNNLDGINYDDYIPLMKAKLEKHTEPFKRQRLEILSTDKKLLQEYNTITQPLFDIVDKKDQQNKQSLYYYLNDIKPWDDNFISECQKNKDNYTKDRKFFFYMNPNKIIDKLQSASVKEIYSFLYGINSVYSFSNLNDFFVEDAQNIHSLLNKLDVEILSNGKHTKKIALNRLEEKLRESLELIEN